MDEAVSERENVDQDERVTEPAPAERSMSEMVILRDLLFGEQSRSIDARHEAIERELRESNEALRASFNQQLTTLSSEINDKMEAQGGSQGEQLEQLQSSLLHRLDELERHFGERLDSLARESRERDDALRSELLAAASSLEDQKASRHDLGQMLAEVGRRLTQENASADA